MKIGLSLGGGGAKGIAHIEVLKVFDEVGIKPAAMSGTSIGALFGCMYASGMSGEEIWTEIEALFLTKIGSPLDLLTRRNVFRWVKFLDLDFSSKGLLKGDEVIEYLAGKIRAKSFSDLEIPFKMVAAESGHGHERVLTEGCLLSALRASIAIPGLFPPVKVNNELLMDGGVVNPLPYQALTGCDHVIAIDVMGVVKESEREEAGECPEPTNGMLAISEAFDHMQRSIIREKLNYDKPDYYVKMPIHGVGLLEFQKANRIKRIIQPELHALRSHLIQLKEGA